VSAVLSGRDVLAVMPTGSGKSLCYQLPALVLPGLTLVVSPLISLMKDQVDELNRRRIPSGAVHSMLPFDRRRSVLDAARAGRLRLLYVAPERFASDEFMRLLRELTIARFVIDEAHCVSQWGHDFRPDYRRLRAAAAGCRTSTGTGRPPIAAFTATATQEVRDDIVALTGLESPQVLVAGFDRPNIFLRVKRADEFTKDALLPYLVGNRRALVYAATRRTTEAAAETLQDAGIAAAAYHAGFKDDQRTRVQDAFARGSLRVVCATNAFGMGIDRPDVEAVIHYAIPGSVEAYYQEIGRAGRDGRRATATLLWDQGDVSTRRFLIDSPSTRFARSGQARSARVVGCRPRRGREAQGDRAQEAGPDDRVRRDDGLPARDDPSLLRRPRRPRAVRGLRELCSRHPRKNRRRGGLATRRAPPRPSGCRRSRSAASRDARGRVRRRPPCTARDRRQGD